MKSTLFSPYEKKETPTKIHAPVETLSYRTHPFKRGPPLTSAINLTEERARVRLLFAARAHGDEDHREARAKPMDVFQWWFNATACRCPLIRPAITRIERSFTMGIEAERRRDAFWWDRSSGLRRLAPMAASASFSQWDTYHPYPTTSCHRAGVEKTSCRL